MRNIDIENGRNFNSYINTNVNVCNLYFLKINIFFIHSDKKFDTTPACAVSVIWPKVYSAVYDIRVLKIIFCGYRTLSQILFT